MISSIALTEGSTFNAYLITKIGNRILNSGNVSIQIQLKAFSELSEWTLSLKLFGFIYCTMPRLRCDRIETSFKSPDSKLSIRYFNRRLHWI